MFHNSVTSLSVPSILSPGPEASFPTLLGDVVFTMQNYRINPYLVCKRCVQDMYRRFLYIPNNQQYAKLEK